MTDHRSGTGKRMAGRMIEGKQVRMDGSDRVHGFVVCGMPGKLPVIGTFRLSWEDACTALKRQKAKRGDHFTICYASLNMGNVAESGWKKQGSNG